MAERNQPAPNSGLQPTWPAALPPSKLCHHGVAGHAAEPWSVSPPDMKNSTREALGIGLISGLIAAATFSLLLTFVTMVSVTGTSSIDNVAPAFFVMFGFIGAAVSLAPAVAAISYFAASRMRKALQTGSRLAPLVWRTGLAVVIVGALLGYALSRSFLKTMLDSPATFTIIGGVSCLVATVFAYKFSEADFLRRQKLQSLSP